jgi:hypothetical protein
MRKIFISYRRQDSKEIAGHIYDRLCQQFGKVRLFIDFDTISPGAPFPDRIREEVGRAEVVLALIGETWLTAYGPNGRRLDDPDDWVRIELEIALSQDIPIIPVLLGAASMPKMTELPQSIADLSLHNALPFAIGNDFENHMDRLIRSISIYLPEHDLGDPTALSPFAPKYVDTEGVFKPILRGTREKDIEKYLELKASYRLVHAPATVERFQEIIGGQHFVVIDG